VKKTLSVFGSLNPCGCWVLWRSRCVFTCCPRRALQGLQAGTRLSMLLPPPSMMLSTWSASVATFMPHQWHGGLSASSRALFFLNSVLFRVALFRLVAMLTRLRLVLPRRQAGLLRVLVGWSLCRVQVCCVCLCICYVFVCKA